MEDEVQKGLTIIANLEDIYMLGNNMDDEECKKVG